LRQKVERIAFLAAAGPAISYATGIVLASSIVTSITTKFTANAVLETAFLFASSISSSSSLPFLLFILLIVN